MKRFLQQITFALARLESIDRSLNFLRPGWPLRTQKLTAGVGPFSGNFSFRRSFHTVASCCRIENGGVAA